MSKSQLLTYTHILCIILYRTVRATEEVGMLSYFFGILFPKSLEETPEEKKRRLTKALLLVFGSVYGSAAIALVYIYWIR